MDIAATRQQWQENKPKPIDLEELINSANPDFFRRNRLVGQLGLRVLERMIHLAEINSFLAENSHIRGEELIARIFEYLDFSYRISARDRERIPSEGRLIVVANHPLGGLDGLALLKAVLEVRKDVRIVANNLLLHISNMSQLFLPYDLSSYLGQKENIQNIQRALENEEAVIIFPAGEVSRPTVKGVQDCDWKRGAVHFATKTDSPILPVFIEAGNSFLFNLTSVISQKLSFVMLPGEVFNKKGKNINLKIGNPIPATAIKSTQVSQASRLLKKHVYLIGSNKKGIFATERTVIHPVERTILKSDFQNSILIGTTFDGKKIWLCDFSKSAIIAREVARLREVTFRKVKEGTGYKMDTDRYDEYYQHLVLWDESRLQVVGSYRFGYAGEILTTKGLDGLYTSTLFRYSPKLAELLPQALELGRSFICDKYWNSNALDYLWQGIGVYLAKNPQIRYLFGAVSISNVYPRELRDMLVYYYAKWYGSLEKLAEAICRYKISPLCRMRLNELFNSGSAEGDYKILSENLKNRGFTVPVLYRQYSKLCEEGGAIFLDFCVDNSFSGCIDGLILVDITKMKKDKYHRYIASKQSDSTT